MPPAEKKLEELLEELKQKLRASAEQLAQRLQEKREMFIRTLGSDLNKLADALEGGEFLIISATREYKVVCDADKVEFYNDEIVVNGDKDPGYLPAWFDEYRTEEGKSGLRYEDMSEAEKDAEYQLYLLARAEEEEESHRAGEGVRYTVRCIDYLVFRDEANPLNRSVEYFEDYDDAEECFNLFLAEFERTDCRRWISFTDDKEVTIQECTLGPSSS